MAGQDGEGRVAGGLEGTEAARIVAVRSNAILSLDKAETIAARRLRELAIRLRDDDTQAEAERVPFDADRHFRERLAERMAALGADTAGTEPPKPIPYAVSDALSLSALGLSAPLLAGSAVQAQIDVVRTDNAPAGEMPLGLSHGDDPGATPKTSAAAEEDDDYPVFEPGVRLVDLINQQRTLVTRLADMSLVEDVEPVGGVDVAAFDSGEIETAETAETAERSVVADAVTARSDAEELFEAATHTPEPVQHDTSGDEALVPLAISAEQLIAALEAGPLSLKTDATVPEEKQLVELVLNDHRLNEPRRRLADTHGESAERAPMIIERARAEMAMAASEATRRPVRQSGAVGFFAGLSLSIAVGVVLYYSL